MWKCATCGRTVIPGDGVTAIYDRGYYWCCHCVQIDHWKDGVPVVAFPSVGKLIPAVIMQGGEE